MKPVRQVLFIPPSICHKYTRNITIVLASGKKQLM